MDSGERDQWNACRFRGGQPGHYESYFQRANHPDRCLAFWIRYTIFSPAGKADATIGELWAAYFDGENGRAIAVKQELPWVGCEFSQSRLEASIGSAHLDGGSLAGTIDSQRHSLGWKLDYHGDQEPLLLLPRDLYQRNMPRAKAVVGMPNACYRGQLLIDGKRIDVDDWVGSQNHNWGSRHTDEYAWGQVAGFDDDADSFLECATSRLRIGPIPTPWMTMVVFRYHGREYRLNSLGQALRAEGHYQPFQWSFASHDQDIALRASIEAPASSFVGLRYYNPPGGVKTCLNSKIARCRLEVTLAGQAPQTLYTRSRAAFEILTDRSDHGITITV